MKFANAFALTFLFLNPVIAKKEKGNNADFVKFITEAKKKLGKSDFLEGQGRKLAPIGIQIVEAPTDLYFHGFLADGDREIFFETGPYKVHADCDRYRDSRASIILEIDGESDLFVFGSISGDDNGNSDDIEDFVLPSEGSYFESMWSVDGARGGIDDDTGAFFATDGFSADYIAILGDTTIGVYQQSFDDNSKEDAADILESDNANVDQDQEDNNCFYAGGIKYYSDDLVTVRR